MFAQSPKSQLILILSIVGNSKMSLVIPEKFQHILRIMSTNIDGKRKVPVAMTAIKGVGRRYSSVVLRKADVDLNKRAGECTEEEVRFLLFHMSIGQLSLTLVVILLVGRENRHDHLEPTPVQDPRLVP